ncbi:hypothetical protein GCM10023096_32880 [Nonomuraea ferruginea]
MRVCRHPPPSMAVQVRVVATPVRTAAEVPQERVREAVSCCQGVLTVLVWTVRSPPARASTALMPHQATFALL